MNALAPVTVEPGLSAAEKMRLVELEKVIDEGGRSFLAVGHALAEIRRDNLYRASGTFEGYVKERFGFGRNYAFRLQAAAHCANAVGVDSCQLSEGTLRPLTRLIDLRKTDEPTEKQKKRIRAAWEKAVELADGRPITGRMVLCAVDLISPKPKEHESKGGKRVKKSLPIYRALEEAREWAKRWGHIAALAPVCDAINALKDIEEVEK